MCIRDRLRPPESKRCDRPNQGIRRSAQNALQIDVVGVVFGVLLGVPAGVLGGVRVGVWLGVLFGVLGRTMFGWELRFSEEAVIKHYILRLLLALHHLLPLRLIPFLEAMRERTLLQRAGAHYRFIHRTLQEHIAALSDDRIEALTR